MTHQSQCPPRHLYELLHHRWCRNERVISIHSQQTGHDYNKAMQQMPGRDLPPFNDTINNQLDCHLNVVEVEIESIQ